MERTNYRSSRRPAKEWQEYGFSLLCAYLLTTLFYLAFNTIVDGKLRSAYDDLCQGEHCTDLADWYEFLLGGPSLEAMRSLSTGDSTLPDGSDHLGKFLGLILYGAPEAESWAEARPSILLPYVSVPNQSQKTILALALPEAEWQPIVEKQADKNEDKAAEYRGTLEDQLAKRLGEVLDPIKNTSVYRIRRYFNGLIQFLTFLLAFTGMIHLLVFHRVRARRMYTGGDVDPEQDGAAGQILRIFRRMGENTAIGSLQELMNEKREEVDSRRSMIRYIAWGVPSVGFIGTVLGIGKALENAHTVITPNGGSGTTGAIESLTASLGLAFDTTLVALLLSLILMLEIHSVSRYEDFAIERWGREVWGHVMKSVVPTPSDEVDRFAHLLSELEEHLRPDEMKHPEVREMITYLQSKMNQSPGTL